MPRKNALTPVRLVAAGDLSADYISPVTAIAWLDNLCYEVVLSGAPVGTLDVEVSLDYSEVNGVVKNAGNWQSIGSTYQATVNGAGQGIFDLNQLGAPWVRLHYTRTSGTGTIAIYISGKEI